ncbi:hypothetical protein ACLOJK_038310 [Asimina triloba]
MSACLSMSAVGCGSRNSSSNSFGRFQNPTARPRSLPFLLRTAEKKLSPFILSTSQSLDQTKKPHFGNFGARAAAASGAAVEEAEEDWTPASEDESEDVEAEAEADKSEYEKGETEKLGVVVEPMSKPRLVLKFIWLEKNIGLALDQIIPGYGIIPLSPYYFWPRKDAWEELKTTLESKPWISQKRMIILLNQATDIINLWQQSGGNL